MTIPIRTEVALNLRPGDEIELDGNWWRVERCEVDFNKPAPVKLELQSRQDSMTAILLAFPSQQFAYEPR